MFSNRILHIFLFALLVHLGLSTQQAAHAAIIKKYIDKSTPLLVIANSCQGAVTETADASMSLPISEELATELNTHIANGESPVVAVHSHTEFLVAGTGLAGYQGQVRLYLDQVDGNRIELGHSVEQHISALSITMSDVIISSYLTSQVMPGDNISVEVTGQGFADAGGCNPADQAGVNWEVASALCINEVIESCLPE